MILPLITDKILLSKKSDDIMIGSIHTSEVQDLIDNMIDTLSYYSIRLGARGIAACQVGANKNIIVVKKFKLLNKYDTYINLKILGEYGKKNGTEGCLSLPNVVLMINRPKRIRISYYDREGRYYNKLIWGVLARILCHEHDHSDGKTIIDRKKEEIKENKKENENER